MHAQLAQNIAAAAGLGGGQQHPPAVQGNFALPQPTNSGALDLSHIKPVNSGTVSLADAIARAKSIAAERGVSGGTYRTENQGEWPWEIYSRPLLILVQLLAMTTHETNEGVVAMAEEGLAPVHDPLHLEETHIEMATILTGTNVAVAILSENGSDLTVRRDVMAHTVLPNQDLMAHKEISLGEAGRMQEAVEEEVEVVAVVDETRILIHSQNKCT